MLEIGSILVFVALLLGGLLIGAAVLIRVSVFRKTLTREAMPLSCVMVLVLFVLLPLVLLQIRSSWMQTQRDECATRLGRIGKAMSAYAARNNGFWPYDARGPLPSLALLYPEYVSDAGLFVCPSMGRKERHRFPPGCSLEGRACSYAYDPEGAPGAMGPGAARMADVFGNHGGSGVNVLCWDGHVYFANTVYASEHPQDSIFARDPEMDVDRDAFVRQ